MNRIQRDPFTLALLAYRRWPHGHAVFTLVLARAIQAVLSADCPPCGRLVPRRGKARSDARTLAEAMLRINGSG